MAAPAGHSGSPLRELPSVDHLLSHPAIAPLLRDHPRPEVVAAIRQVLDERRQALRSGSAASLEVAALALDVRRQLHLRERPTLRRVINATGIVLHTGLGRAPLADEAVQAIADVAAAYSNLELDLQRGQRGDRQDHLRPLLRELTGAEDALVVNNNAAATLLALRALAAGRAVIVSRGQLVEIGGSYRMPEIMAASGCRMVEVGTTNRTRLADYERACDADTAILLRVHTSNYRILGFVESVPLRQLVELAARRPAGHRPIVVHDLGSGMLFRPPRPPFEPADLQPPPDVSIIEPAAAPPEPQPPTPTAPDTPSRSDESMLHASSGAPPPAAAAVWDEPTVRDSVRDGADLTLFSGDKLLGGPQAGVIVGRSELIRRLAADPLMRACRPDKMTLAGLEATLRLYRDPQWWKRVPAQRLLHASAAQLESTARAVAQRIGELDPTLTVECAPDCSFAGGGALPTVALPTWVVRVRAGQLDPTAIAGALRSRDLPVIARVHGQALVLDCRTLLPGDEQELPTAVVEAIRELAGP